GALLKNMDKVISDESEIPVFIADNPLQGVAEGTGKSLDYIQHFKNQPNVAVRTTMEYEGAYMSFFRNKSLFLLLFLVILLVFLVGYSLTGRDDLTTPEKFLMDSVGWVQYIVNQPITYVSEKITDVKEMKHTYEENKLLRE